jgi:hypothetical protein
VVLNSRRWIVHIDMLQFNVVWVLVFFLVICLSGQKVEARGSVEIVPIAVWQGKPTRSWSVGLFRDLRKKFPLLKIAHAVSPAPMVRGGEFDLGFRVRFARIIQPGDDVLLHVAPWKSMVQKADLEFRTEPTVFGMPVNIDDCSQDCGLDLSTKAFNPAELRKVILFSKSLLAAHGFGNTQAVFFDEGIISRSVRQQLGADLFREDWSGVEISQLKSNLMRFPIYQWNLENIVDLPLTDHSVAADGSVHLDHIRFALQAEISDLESANRLFISALKAAKEQNRVVRVPIVFNVEELIHTKNFLEESIQLALQLASNMSVPIREWSALNSEWNADAIRDGEAAKRVMLSAKEGPHEAEFIPDDERFLSIDMAH